MRPLLRQSLRKFQLKTPVAAAKGFENVTSNESAAGLFFWHKH